VRDRTDGFLSVEPAGFLFVEPDAAFAAFSVFDRVHWWGPLRIVVRGCESTFYAWTWKGAVRFGKYWAAQNQGGEQ
jgi:hypothetical protein